jgi:hypothetical protein
MEDLTAWTRLAASSVSTLAHAVTQTVRSRRMPGGERRDEGSVSAEMVVVTALLVGLAITVVGIIAARVTGWARNIHM